LVAFYSAFQSNALLAAEMDKWALQTAATGAANAQNISAVMAFAITVSYRV